MSAQCEVGCAPKCTTCKRRKKPMGRDSMDNGLCSWECEGYLELPWACDLWPGECRACFREGTCEKHLERDE